MQPPPVPGWVSYIEAAKDWGSKPWEITVTGGQKLTPYKRILWMERYRAYTSELSAKLRRDRQALEDRINNG